VSVDPATEHPAAEFGASNEYAYAPVPDPPVPLSVTIFEVADQVTAVVVSESVFCERRLTWRERLVELEIT
jgi:hypothetical protein